MMCMAFVIVEDVLFFRVLNRIPIALAILFFARAALGGIGPDVLWPDILWHVGVAALVLALGFGMHAFNVMGGGDIKLIVAVSLWAGPSQILQYLFLMAVVGGIWTVLLFGLRHLLAALPGFASWADRRPRARVLRRGEPIPYGVAIAGAFMIVFWRF